MDNGNDKNDLFLKAPQEPRKKAAWLRRWIETIFNVYGNVMDQAAKAMPEKNLETIVFEVNAVKEELLSLITPEKWERVNEPGKS